jgi:hypothetical protein
MIDQTIDRQFLLEIVIFSTDDLNLHDGQPYNIYRVKLFYDYNLFIPSCITNQESIKICVIDHQMCSKYFHLK